MADMSGRRMAYRNAVRAAFYENEAERKKEKSANIKIYFAHGYVIYSENRTTGDEIWDRNLAFSQVFFDFEKASEDLKEIIRKDWLKNCAIVVAPRSKAEKHYAQSQRLFKKVVSCVADKLGP